MEMERFRSLKDVYSLVNSNKIQLVKVNCMKCKMITLTRSIKLSMTISKIRILIQMIKFQ
jgi:hypothetical protein